MDHESVINIYTIIKQIFHIHKNIPLMLSLCDETFVIESKITQLMGKSIKKIITIITIIITKNTIDNRY